MIDADAGSHIKRQTVFAQSASLQCDNSLDFHTTQTYIWWTEISDEDIDEDGLYIET